MFHKQTESDINKETCFACGFPNNYGVFAKIPKFIRLRIELSTDEPYENGSVFDRDGVDRFSPKFKGPKAIALYACPDCGTIQARERK